MLPQGVKKGRPDVESESIRVTVDRKSDQNPTVAGRERHRLGVGLVEASSHKRKGCSGDRSAEKTTSVDRLRFITAFRRHWAPPLPENGTLSPRRPAPGRISPKVAPLNVSVSKGVPNRRGRRDHERVTGPDYGEGVEHRMATTSSRWTPTARTGPALPGTCGYLRS
jgi:hypothetical protein